MSKEREQGEKEEEWVSFDQPLDQTVAWLQQQQQQQQADNNNNSGAESELAI